MGWYVSCSFCGKEEKGITPQCDCMDKEMKKICEKRQNSIILESYTKYLVEKLQDISGNEFYTGIEMSRYTYEQGLYNYFFWEMSSDDYNTYLKNIKKIKLNNRCNKKIKSSKIEIVDKICGQVSYKFVEKFQSIRKSSSIDFEYGNNYSSNIVRQIV